MIIIYFNDEIAVIVVVVGLARGGVVVGVGVGG
jgi:hypothetical protein